MSKATDAVLVQDAQTPDSMTPPPKRTFMESLISSLKTPGSAVQIILAAIIAIAIGISISTTISEVPEAAPAIIEIPGDLWLRALQATSTVTLFS